MNLNDAHKQFIRHLKRLGRSKATIIAYNKDIEQLIDYMARLGKTDPKDVTLEDLNSFMAHFIAEGYTPKSVSRKTNSTKTFFSFMTDKGYVSKNVAENLKHPKVELAPPRILSQMEYRALRDVARNDRRAYVMLEVFLQTGLSISEVSALELDHIHLNDDEPYIYIPARDSKLERRVPLNPAIVSLLRDYIQNDRAGQKGKHLFVTRTGRPMLVRNIRAMLHRYFIRAGLKDVSVNDLRHTFIAHNLLNGVSLPYLSKVLGHKRLSTTERYLSYVDVDPVGSKAELAVL